MTTPSVTWRAEGGKGAPGAPVPGVRGRVVTKPPGTRPGPTTNVNHPEEPMTPTEALARQIDSEWQADETAAAMDHDPHADYRFDDPFEVE